MSHPWIKICGVTTAAVADAAVRAGADAVGFVRAPGSPRLVDLDHAITLAERLPPSVAAVAVFRRPRLDDVLAWPFPWVQIHGGEEDEAWLAELAAEVGGTKSIIRGFAFSPESVTRWDDCPHLTALLVDGADAGTGDAFDHGALAPLVPTLRHHLIVAGGLNPESVADVIERVRPWGVDVSSGVETRRGEKDPGLVERFCRAARG